MGLSKSPCRASPKSSPAAGNSPPIRLQKQPGSWDFSPDQAPKAARQRMIRPLCHRFFLSRPRNSMKDWIRIHLFSSLSTSNQPKDLKTKCFVRVVLPQIPSLYPSERYKDLKITIPQDCRSPGIPSFHPQNSVKRLESPYSGRTAGSGGRAGDLAARVLAVLLFRSVKPPL